MLHWYSTFLWLEKQACRVAIQTEVWDIPTYAMLPDRTVHGNWPECTPACRLHLVRTAGASRWHRCTACCEFASRRPAATSNACANDVHNNAAGTATWQFVHTTRQPHAERCRPISSGFPGCRQLPYDRQRHNLRRAAEPGRHALHQLTAIAARRLSYGKPGPVPDSGKPYRKGTRYGRGSRPCGTRRRAIHLHAQDNPDRRIPPRHMRRPDRLSGKVFQHMRRRDDLPPQPT